MHPRLAAILLLAISAISATTAGCGKDAKDAGPADTCSKAVDHGIALIKTEYAAHEANATADCGLMSTETLNCTIAATDMKALTSCLQQAMTAQLTIPAGDARPDQALCDRSAANQRKLMFGTLDAARQPRIDACRVAKAAHTSCQLEAKTAMDWMKCDPDMPSLIK